MKANKKSISTVLCMIIFALACVIGVNAKAASPEAFFSTTTVSGGVKITGYSGAESVIDIPEKIRGKNVVAIGKNFISSMYRAEVEEVVVPKYVTTIDSYAFYGCKKLQKVVLGAKVASVGSSAFQGCSALNSINFPSALRKIGEKAFYGCSFYYLSIPGTVETIGNYAFGDIKQLREISINNGTKTLGINICSVCPNLERMYLPSSVTSISTTLVPTEDVTLYIYNGSYAMKFINDKNLNNKIIYRDNVTPSTFKFKAASKTNRKYVFYVGESVNMASTLEVSSNNTNAITWSSSKSSVLSVDRYGRITAKSAGTATLVAKASVNPTKTAYTKRASVNITVKKAPTKVLVMQKTGNKVLTSAKSSHKIYMSGNTGSIELAARTTPAGGAQISFTSSNTKVAKVGTKKTATIGKYTYTYCTITGLSEGTADITARSYNGKKTVYSVTVEKKRTQVKGNWGMAATYQVTKGAALNQALNKLKGMPKNVQFLSANTQIATVNKYGVITGKKPGVTKVLAHLGTQKAESTVIVLPAKMKITRSTAGSKKITVRWSKQAGVSGYQISYKKASVNWSRAKTINVSASKTSYTVKRLTKGTKYSVRIRGYVTYNKKKVAGAWSTVKSLKAK